MREILFRGKDLQEQNGWLYGYFYKSDINKRERESGKATLIFTPDCDTFIYVPEYHNSWMVKSETVGQYTGLTDKNGTRVFEGDVVKLFDIAIGEIVYGCGTFGISCRQQIDYDYLASEIASITGCDNTPMFCRNDNFVSLWELYSNYNEENSEISVIEVIGNIYDNPELLKGE